MIRDYPKFFAICKRIKRDYKDVVAEFTKGQHSSLRQLTDSEFAELMRRLARFNTPPPGDAQRKKMIAICRKMHYGKPTDEILAILDNWCLKQKYAKPLMGLDLQQLGVLVTIYETKVYTDYLKGLNK